MFHVFSYAESLISHEIVRLAVKPISILSSGITMIALPLMLVWITYRSYLVMAGFSSEPFMQIMKDLLIKSTILIMAGTLGFLYTSVVNPLIGTQDDLSTDFTGSTDSVFVQVERNINDIALLLENVATGKEPSQSEVDAATAANGGEPLGFFSWARHSISGMWTTVKDAATDLGGFFTLLLTTFSYLVVIIGLIALGIAAFMAIIINKIFFMLSLGFAPLFIMFLAFDTTKGWFSSWLNSTIGYCLSYPLVVLTVKILLDIYSSIYAQDTFSFVEAAICFVTSVLFAVLIARLGDVASSWFGAGNIADGTALAMTALAKGMGSKGASVAAGGAKAGGQATARGTYRIGRSAYNAYKKTKLKDGS